MKKCTYTVKNYNNPFKYEDLYDILKGDIQLVNDILYSKDLFSQSRIVDTLIDLKQKNSIKFKEEFKTVSEEQLKQIYENQINVDGCSELNVDESLFYTLQSFIDSGKYSNNDGTPIMPELRIEDFKNRMRSIYKRHNPNISEEEIDFKLNFLVNNWTKISKDGGDLHKIVLRYNQDMEISDINKLTKDTSFSSDIIPDVENKIIRQVRLHNRRESKEVGDTSKIKIIKNINLTAPIINDSKQIKAHIDYIVIKPDGSLEIFNIKSSHESREFWDNAKVEKYMNECALINRILQANNIPTKNIRFNIIPAILKYDDSFNKVIDVTVQDAVCYSHKNGKFILQEAFNNAAKFIEANINEFEVTDELLDKTNKELITCFPESGVKAKGIHITAEEYVKENWNYIIDKRTDEGYVVTLGDNEYQINDSRIKADNKTLVELVKQHQKELLETGELSTQSILSQLKNCRRNGYVQLGDSYLEQLFLPYFNHTEKDGKIEYEWQLCENKSLAECGIIMFKHRLTNQVDFITLSGMALDVVHKIKNNENILGTYLHDIEAVDIQGKKLMKSTYGNIEVMRTLFLLNNILPDLDNNIQLGNLTIVGNLGKGTKGQIQPIQLVLPNFIKAVQVLRKANPSLQITNNFIGVKNISPVELLVNQFYAIIQENDYLKNTALSELKTLVGGSSEDAKQHLINGLVIDSIASAESVEIQIQRIEEFIAKLNEILRQNQVYNLSPNNLITLSEKDKQLSPTSNLISACSKLIIEASIVLDRLSGIISIQESDLSTEDKEWTRPQNLVNDQVRMVGSLLQKAIQNTQSRLESRIVDFNKACLEYYEAKGYGKIRNAVLSDQVKIFEHLYQDIEDELFFKNPFDMTNDLDDSDRKFLKVVLLTINKSRDPNISDLKSYIESHKNSLWVPLEKASESTKYSNLEGYFQDFKRRCGEYCANPSKFFKEMYEGILTDDQEKTLRQDIENLQAYNKFRRSESAKGRPKLLRDYKKSYFETNIQNLVIDYINSEIQEDEMNKMLVRTKGILLYLKLLGLRQENSDKQYESAIKYINDYLKTSVYGVSIMNDDVKSVIAKIQPLRRMVSKAYIAMNPTGAVRDTIGGFLSNMVRSATKYKTDVSPSDILWAYQYIIGKGVHSAMDIDLLDKFNTKYLISNINLESPQEGYKTNRGGITNISNLMYATLKKPDYLNRMVLFIAKLRKDGSLNAYSVENGYLKYNWKLDKRFSLLAENDKSDLEKYNKQKALYLSQIIKYNEANPNQRIPVMLSSNLPEGYTIPQIEVIKHLSDSIYGSYSQSTKAMYENRAIGSQLGVFSTWMNGIYDVYLGKRRVSEYETTLEQAYDDNGNLLYIDDNGIITTTPTDSPYMKDVPLMVQGVFKTIGDMFSMLRDVKSTSDLKQIIKFMYSNPIQRRNWKRLFSDILIALLLRYLFKEVFDPAYKEHKKTTDGNDIIINGIIELLYKGGASCYEEFRGPLPIIDYVSNNIKPASWQLGSNIVLDVGGVVFGDKTMTDLIFKYNSLPRAFKDTYKLYQRDNKVSLD